MASLLLLDVSGVYDKVSHRRLLYNLRKRSIDPLVVKWIESFLANRTTMLKTSEYTILRTQITIGIL